VAAADPAEANMDLLPSPERPRLSSSAWSGTGINRGASNPSATPTPTVKSYSRKKTSTLMSDEPTTSEERSGRILAHPNFGGLLRVEPTSDA
jgi:hypothetical protein